MSFLSKIFRRNDATALAKSADGRLGAFGSLNQAYGWAPLSVQSNWAVAGEIFGPITLSFIEAAIAHPIVGACHNAIASRAPEPRIEIGRWIKDEWAAVKSHWALDLIAEPCTESRVSRNYLISQLAGRRSLTGLGAALKIRNRAKNKIVALIPIPSSWVYLLPNQPPDPDHPLWLYKAYRLMGANAELHPPTEIVLCRTSDPRHNASTLGFVEMAWRDYKTDVERSNYQGEMVTNLKVPGVMISAGKDQRFTPAQREQLQTEYDERFGRGSRGKPMIGDSQSTIQVVNPLADMDWPGLTGLGEARICGAAGVPQAMAMTREGTSVKYSNWDVAERVMYRGTMATIWKALADDLTTDLLRMENEPELEFRFRYDELPAFQEDAGEKSKRVSLYFSSGLLNRRAAQRVAGFDPDALAEEEREEAAQAALDDNNSNTEDVPTTSLQGQQVTALQAILTAVGTGALTAESAKIMIRLSFPAFEDAAVDAMVSAIPEGANKPEPPVIVQGAPGAPPQAMGPDGKPKMPMAGAKPQKPEEAKQ